jgi:uncharacterized protein
MNIMITPCILICALDDETGFCCGCGRTLDEIGGWAGYTDAERQHVMTALPARLQNLATVEGAGAVDLGEQAS